MQETKVLIVVENLPVPFDRRVWAESLALRDAGYKVSVVCPNQRMQAPHEELEGVSIYRYPRPPQGTGMASYLVDMAIRCLWRFGIHSW